MPEQALRKGTRRERKFTHSLPCAFQCLRRGRWWRWGESNPRPEELDAGVYKRSLLFIVARSHTANKAAFEPAHLSFPDLAGDPPGASPLLTLFLFRRAESRRAGYTRQPSHTPERSCELCFWQLCRCPFNETGRLGLQPTTSSPVEARHPRSRILYYSSSCKRRQGQTE